MTRNRMFWIAAAVAFAVVFAIAFSGSGVVAYAAEVESANGFVDTAKIQAGWDRLIDTEASMKLEGQQLKSASDANPISVLKSLAGQSDVAFSDPQLKKAIASKRLKIDVLITGSNSFEFLKDGVWTDDFSDSSVLEYEIVSDFSLPAYGISVDVSGSRGAFSGLKVIEGLTLNEALMVEYGLRMELDSSLMVKKEPSLPGEHETGVRFKTEITKIEYRLSFESLEVEIEYAGEYGCVRHDFEDFEALGGQRMSFEIGFKVAMYDPSNPSVALNRPLFEAKEAFFNQRTYYFVGWQSRGGHVGPYDFKQKYLETNFLEEVASGVVVSYRATFRPVDYINAESSEIEFKESGADLPKLYLLQADTSTTSFHVGLIESFEEVSTGATWTDGAKPTDVGEYDYNAKVTLGLPNDPANAGGYLENKISISLSRRFKIVKCKASLSFKLSGVELGYQNSASLRFGEPLAYLDLEMAARIPDGKLEGGTFEFVDKGDDTGNVIDARQVFTRELVAGMDIMESTIGLKSQYVRYTPKDPANYAIAYGSFNLNVENKMSSYVLNEDVGASPRERAASLKYYYTNVIDTSTGVASNLSSGATLPNKVVKARFEIDFNDSTGYFFYLGISQLKPGKPITYLKGSGGANAIFDYYFLDVATSAESDVSNELQSRFSVDFVKDVTALDPDLPAQGQDLTTYKLSYRGDKVNPSLPIAFEDQSQNNFLSYTAPKYFEDGDTTKPSQSKMPCKVGTHIARYEVRLQFSPTDFQVIGVRDLIVRIDKAEIAVTQHSAVGLNAETGWARSEDLSIVSQGVGDGGVTEYYVSSDGKNTFAKISGLIGSGAGCPIGYAPAAPASGSREISYDFIAVNNSYGESVTYGSATYKVVAEASVPYVSRLDNMAPSISSVTPRGALAFGTWTKGDFAVDVTVSHGSSGVKIKYKVGATGSVEHYAHAVWQGLGQAPGSHVYQVFVGDEALRNGILDSSEHGEVFFIAEGGTGLENVYATPCKIDIDKVAPEINIEANIVNRWWNKDALVKFRVSESGSGTSVSNAYVSSDNAAFKNLAMTKESASVYSLTFETDSEGAEMRYSVFVTDDAGNKSATRDILIKVDKTTLSATGSGANVSYSAVFSDRNDNMEKAYSAGSWANNDVRFNFNVSGGSSKLKVSYKKASASAWIEGSFEGVGNPISLHKEIVISGSSDGENAAYEFRVSNEAGASVLISDFGVVKIDKKAPQIALPDGFSDWRSAPQTLSMSVTEPEAQILSSGIRKVEYRIGDTTSWIAATLNSDGGYDFVVTSCLMLHARAEDNAGNVVEVSTGNEPFKYKVDPVSFTSADFEHFAYAEGGNPEDPNSQDVTPSTTYGFGRDEWSKEHVRIEVKMTKIPASGAWIEFAALGANPVMLSYLEPSLESDFGAVDPNFNSGSSYNKGKMVLSGYVLNERTGAASVRLATGAGATFTLWDSASSYVNIDKVKPSISETEKKAGLQSFDFLNQWASEDCSMKVEFLDALSGIKTIKLEQAVPGSGSFSDVTSTMLREVAGADGKYEISFDSYMEYRFTVIDKAGNETVRNFEAMIDKFADFDISAVEEKLVDMDNGTESAYSLKWLAANEAVRLGVAYSLTNGATEAGPSGLFVEFLVEGQSEFSRHIDFNTPSGTERQEFAHDVGARKFDMLIKCDQLKRYVKLRLVTGAGVAIERILSLEVKKDASAISFSVSASVAGASYSSTWTRSDIDLEVLVESGPNAKSLFFAFADAFSADLDWVEMGDLISSEQTFYKKISQTMDSKIFFKVGTWKAGTEAYFDTGFAIKLDKGSIVPEISATVSSGAYGSGTWCSEKVTLSYSKSGDSISPISRVELKEDLNPYSPQGGMSSTCEVDVPGDASLLRKKYFRIRVENEAGKVEESEIFHVWQSLRAPSFTYSLASELGKPKVDGWYLERVKLTLDVANPGDIDFYTGYMYQIRKREPGAAAYGDWEELPLVNGIAYLADGNKDTVKGGSDFEYSIRILAPNGKETVYEGSSDLNIKIDQAIYVAKVSQTMGDLESSFEFSEMSNHEFQARRGDWLPFIEVIPKEGFYYKSISYSDGTNSVDESFTKGELERSFKTLGKTGTASRFKISGQDALVDIAYYRKLDIGVSGAERHLQDGSNEREISVFAKDGGFDRVFGPLKLEGEAYEGICVRISATYYDSDDAEMASFPTELGKYSVSFAAAGASGADFIIDAGKRPLKIGYFDASGTREDPYLVSSIFDFYAIGLYMKYESGYETNDPYSFLESSESGRPRYKSHFKQTSDIAFPRGWFPEPGRFPNADKSALLAPEEGSFVFKGTYDGNGFSISYDGAIMVDASNRARGLFSEIEGAKIRNVIASYDATIALDDVDFGLIAGKAKDSLVLYSYVSGDIQSISRSGVDIGGVIGYAENSLVANAVVDVLMNVSQTAGNVGGIIGSSKDSYCISTYGVGGITADDVALAKEGLTSPDQTYLGALIGHQIYTPAEIVKIENKIRIFGTSVNGEVVTGLATGNEFELPSTKRLAFSEVAIDSLMEDTTQIIRSSIPGNNKSVRDLILIRIEHVKKEVDVEGAGTEESPILIDSASKLEIIAKIPWAYYKQTSDFEVDLYALSEKGGEYASIITSSSFVGTYEGNGKRISFSGQFSSKASYLGFFGILGGKVRNLTLKGLDVCSRGSSKVTIGSLAGMMLEGSVSENVHVGAKVSAVDGGEVVIGGLAGVARGAFVDNSLSYSRVFAKSSKAVVAGGLFGIADGATLVKDSWFSSSVDVEGRVLARAGRFAGYSLSSGVAVSGSKLIKDGLYVNSVPRIQNASSLTSKSVASSYSISEYKRSELDNLAPVKIGADAQYMPIRSYIARVAALSKGKGTISDPYVISSYVELLAIESNLEANYELGSDIVIGDFDGDGLVDDDYTYDFESLGCAKPFSGYLNGKQHRILNLTRPLFGRNAGKVLNLQLDVKYKVHPDGAGPSEPYAIKPPKGAISFGAVASENMAQGLVIGVSVSGSISVVAPDSLAYVGGVIGINRSLEVKANVVNVAKFSVAAEEVFMGGIIGMSLNPNVELLLGSANKAIFVTPAIANGTFVKAGHIAGYVDCILATPPSSGKETENEIYVNGGLIDEKAKQIGGYIE